MTIFDKTLAYYPTELITAVKSFMIQAPGIFGNSYQAPKSLLPFSNTREQHYHRVILTKILLGTTN